MSESPSETPAPPAPPTAPARRGRAAWWALPTLLAVLALGYGLWLQREARRDAERGAAEWREAAEAMQARMGGLDRELEAIRERQKAIESRIGEAAAGNRVLRDEVLGIAERAAVVEDALARLAEQREQSDAILRLNEVDFVLQLGEQRLRLFGDGASAAQAFAIAEHALAAVDDAALATVRQTLALELATLRALPADPRPALRRRIGEVLAALDHLPAREAPAEAVDSERPRVLQLLDQLVTVRRISDSQSALTPIERASRLAALRLQLGLALAALEAQQQDAWQATLARALALFDGLYAEDVATVTAARQALREAAEASLQRSLPEIGSSLRELRALRASRDLGDRRAVPAGAAPAAVDPAATAVEAEHP